MLKLQQKTCFPNISPGGPKNLKLEYRNMVRIVCPIFNSWSFIRIMVLELTDRQRKELIYFYINDKSDISYHEFQQQYWRSLFRRNPTLKIEHSWYSNKKEPNSEWFSRLIFCWHILRDLFDALSLIDSD